MQVLKHNHFVNPLCAWDLSFICKKQFQKLFIFLEIYFVVMVHYSVAAAVAVAVAVAVAAAVAGHWLSNVLITVSLIQTLGLIHKNINGEI